MKTRAIKATNNVPTTTPTTMPTVESDDVDEAKGCDAWDGALASCSAKTPKGNSDKTISTEADL